MMNALYTETESDFDKGLRLLISTFISGGSHAVLSVNPSECRESWVLYSVLKKFGIREKDPPQVKTAAVRQIVSCFPVLLAAVLRKTSGKVATLYGRPNGLPECLAFPWGINIIPSTPLWEPLRVLWMMWKESYLSRVVETCSPKGEYMLLDYSFTDGFYNRESIMAELGIQPFPSDYVVKKIDVVLELFRYGDNYTAFEIIFASHAPDIWNFYEKHSSAYSYADFSRCPEMIDSVLLDLANSKPDSVSPSKPTASCDKKLRVVSGHLKTNGRVTTVCFDGFQELKNLVESIRRQSDEEESKTSGAAQQTTSDFAKDCKLDKDSANKTVIDLSCGVCDRSCGNTNKLVDSQSFNGSGDGVTGRCLTPQPNEVFSRDRGMKKLPHDSESSKPVSWEYLELREAAMIPPVDPRRIGKRKRSVLHDHFDSGSLGRVIRNIVHTYFSENPPPRNFSSVSPACFVFPELPLVKLYGHQTCCGPRQYETFPSDVSEDSRCSGQKVSDVSSSSKDSATTKREVEQSDSVFLRPKPPPRAKLPNKGGFGKESGKQNQVEACSLLATNEQCVTRMGGASNNCGSGHSGSKVTNGMLKSLATSKLVVSQSSCTEGDEESTKQKRLNRHAGTQQTIDRPESDKNLEKSGLDCPQATKDRDGPCFNSEIASGGDLVTKKPNSRTFKPGCAGDFGDLVIGGVPEKPESKHPRNLHLEVQPPPREERIMDTPADMTVGRVKNEILKSWCSKYETSHKKEFVANEALAPIPEDKNDVAYLETKESSNKNHVPRSSKRLSNSDAPKRTSVQDDSLSLQAIASTTSFDRPTGLSADDRQMFLAIKKYLPVPPPVVRSNRRKLSRQALNVMKARGAWQRTDTD